MPRQSSISRKSILVVDCDQNQRRSLALILKRAGYLVFSVDQAREALDSLVNSSYDLVILDIVMVDNQDTLLPSLLRLYPHLPILVFTSDWSPETANEIEQLGVRAHLVKPVTPDCLLDCVEEILRQNPVPN